MAVLGTTSLTGCNSIPDFIGTGSIWIFHQTNAPTSWTKLTDINNRCLRITNGTAGNGGFNPFTDTFTNSRSFVINNASHTLTTGELAIHAHPAGATTSTGSDPAANPATSNWPRPTGGTGGGGGHTHGSGNSGQLDFGVKYIDVIFASKD
jgi:hypothetical protein